VSTIKAINLTHPSAATGITMDTSGNATVAGSMVASSSYAWRNRIFNGDMRIDQRNAGAAVSVNDAFLYTLDRWQGGDASDGVFSVQQDASAPSGFSNSAKVTITTADSSLSATQNAVFRQPIEGYNVSDFAWGTASARTVTLSFWVRSSLTGTFGGAIVNNGFDRSYPFSYTISVADTWEYKTVTITGDTSGTWLTTNGRGLIVIFSLGSGSDLLGTAGAWVGANKQGVTGQTQIIGTLNATWYVTGVQLEVGTAATPFERRDYGRELVMCQRYCQKSYPTGTAPGTTSIGGYAANGGLANGTFNCRSSIRFAAEMRVAPTLSYWDYVGNASRASSWNTGNTRTDNVSSASFALTDIGTSGFLFNDAGGAGNAGSGACSSGVHWLATSEL